MGIFMFNLNKEVHRLQQLRHDKIHGLPDKKRQHNPQVQHIDSTLFDTTAQQENVYISRGFKNRSADFGRRLSKRKGQSHHPGGGYAGHNIRGG